MKTERPKLLYAASDDSADILYATRFFAPDAFIFLRHAGKTSVVLSDLEIDRGRRTAQVDEVIAFSAIAEKLGQRKTPPAVDEVLARFLLDRKIRAVDVPEEFPLRLAQDLAKRGVRVRAVDGSFWPARETKSAAELKQIRAALRITEAGMARGWEVLRASEIAKGRLRWNGRPLTSELLRAEIDTTILRAGGLPKDTIVAGGEQACDPHERGSGPLPADALIIIDIFPRQPSTGYYGDLTRTVVRGRASDAQRKLWDTVLAGQKLALKTMKPGVHGKAVHEGVKAFFTERGFPTGQRDGRWTGFFHGTGHGLGLDLHEAPRMGATILKPGHVFTVEPGLYYPGLGGVRHEDVVAITETGAQLLSKLPKPFEL